MGSVPGVAFQERAQGSLIERGVAVESGKSENKGVRCVFNVY